LFHSPRPWIDSEKAANGGLLIFDDRLRTRATEVCCGFDAAVSQGQRSGRRPAI
jgi:hypothetical protein